MIVFISSISILATRAICSREKPSLCIFKINSAFSSSLPSARPSALPFSNAFLISQIDGLPDQLDDADTVANHFHHLDYWPITVVEFPHMFHGGMA